MDADFPGRSLISRWRSAQMRPTVLGWWYYAHSGWDALDPLVRASRW